MDFNRNLRIVRTSGSSYPLPYKSNVLWVHHDENNNPVAEIWDHGKWVPVGSGDIVIDTEMSDSSLNAIANKTVKKYVDGIASKTDASILSLNEGVAALQSIIDTLNSGYQFMGVATPETNPGTPDQKVFYIANGKDTYTNFGGISITEDEVVILYYDTAWHKLLTGIASQEKLTELDEKINGGTVTTVEASSTTNGLYVNKSNGIITSGSSTSALSFYPIEQGKRYHVTIPKTGSSATFVFSFSSSIISSGNVSSHLDIIGNTEQLESDIIAPIDGYLIVDYSYSAGLPTVTKITDSERGVIGDINAINQDLVSIKSKVDDNKQDLSNIKKDLYGNVIGKEIEAASSTNGKYVNATNSGIITGGSSSSAIAFYPIEKDKTYHVEIPKVGNSATYVFSFADTIMDHGRVPHHLDMIGNSQPLSIDIVAPNYAYLIIDYAYASGMPVVTTKVVDERIFAKLTDIPQAPESKKSLKILYFGNSFTQDSVGYMPFILKGLDENIELTVGIAYTGGASLQRHCANILNQAIGDVSPSNYTYYNKYSNGAEKWISSSNVSAATILADEEWDVVTFQQSSDLAASEFNTYIAPYIYKIEHYLSSYFHTKPIKTGWLLTQSRGNDSESRLSNYNGVAVTARKVMELTSSAFIIPYGTAVQNLRSISSLDALGVGGGMSYDGQHLQEGIGCLVAAYTHTLVCLQLLGIQNRSILGENTRPNESWIIDKAIPLPNWDDSHTVIGITDSNCYLAQMAANLAIKKMFEVTDMSGIDLSVA